MELVHFKGPHETLVKIINTCSQMVPWLRTPTLKLTNRNNTLELYEGSNLFTAQILR